MTEYIWPTITADTTIEELKEIHRQVWDYVMTHDMTKPNTPYLASCAACEYVRQKYPSAFPYMPEFCAHCPIEWPGSKTCSDEGGLFQRFAYERQVFWETGVLSRDEALVFLELTSQIRDVKWKDDLP